MQYPSGPALAFARGLLRAVLLAACVSACSGDDDSSADRGGGGATGNPQDGEGGSFEEPEPGVSYLLNVRPIFASKCVFCHRAGSATGVNLEDPFDPEFGIIGRENTWVSQGSAVPLIVDPGNVENSFLITKVELTELDEHVDGAPMPLHVPPLDDDEMAAVEQWILDGALDDEFFAENVAPIFGTEVTLGRDAGKCTYCHDPESPYTFSVLDVFDPERGMVDRESGYGGKIVAPGEPDDSVLMMKLSADNTLGARMPYAPERLTTAEIDTLKEWIAAGALAD